MTSSILDIGFSQRPTLHACFTSYVGDESSDTKILSTALCVFDLDNVAKIRSRLSITVLEKKKDTVGLEFPGQEFPGHRWNSPDKLLPAKDFGIRWTSFVRRKRL